MAVGSEIALDVGGEAIVINATDIDDSEIIQGLAENPEFRAIQHWTSSMMPPGSSDSSRMGGVFQRDRFVTPSNIFEEMQVAIHAAEYDDTVSGVLETTEALAFSKMSIDCDDPDEEDIWQQIMGHMNMDGLLRRMWREQFTVSQFYAVTRWKRKTFKVRGNPIQSGEGKRARRKSYNLLVPDAVTILDPLRVVPVGNFAFGEEKLVYIANKSESEDFDEVLAGKNTADVIIKNLIVSRYNPSENEKKKIKAITGINVDNLYLMNEENVWRHTETRPDYQRFATVRMKSVFELLDLKSQLRQMDRAYLIGGTNFIVLVKKGSDAQPAKPSEIQALASQVRTTSRVPVLIGDHRLDIEIITPDQDMTLKPERYNSLDARIAARLYLMFMTGNYAAGAKGDDSIKLARVVARGIESRRHMLRRDLQANILQKVMEKNAGKLSAEPKIQFHPRHVALDFDNNMATFYNDLRAAGNLSRDTLLAEFDINQDEEARKRQREDEEYGDIFAPVAIPFGGNVDPEGDGSDEKKGPVDPKAAGRGQGGNRNGGGTNRESSRPNGDVPPNNSPARRRERQKDKNEEK